MITNNMVNNESNNSQEKNYESLLELLTTPIEDQDSINNSYFNKWNSHILTSLMQTKKGEIVSDSQGFPNSYYKSGDDSFIGGCLLKDAAKHVKEYHNKPLEYKNTLVLTHPLYAFIMNNDQMNIIQKRDANEYKKNLLKILNYKKELNFNIVIFDTLHLYANSTSRLLEEGIVDRIYLTHPYTGEAWNIKDIHSLEGQNLFFAGMYNKRCLASLIEDALSGINITRPIYGITDLALKSPLNNSESIKVNKIKYSIRTNKREIPKEQSFTTDEFLEAMKVYNLNHNNSQSTNTLRYL